MFGGSVYRLGMRDSKTVVSIRSKHGGGRIKRMVNDKEKQDMRSISRVCFYEPLTGSKAMGRCGGQPGSKTLSLAIALAPQVKLNP